MHNAIEYIKTNLSGYYSDNESDSISLIIFEHVLGYSRLQVHLNRNELVGEYEIELIKKIVDRLKANEPIQYILGKTDFYGLSFKVTPDVLIPRPETEELVDWIIKEESRNSPKILDIGTGSGCIPITLAKNIPNAIVSGWDISEKTLAIAVENAKKLNATVEFERVDILNWKNLNISNKNDIIVSNPPYVRHLEKKMMSPNVLENEPQMALFVPDNDALVFYREIAAFASEHLAYGGRLYFEINEALGTKMTELLKKTGFNNVVLKKDINGKERMVKGMYSP